MDDGQTIVAVSGYFNPIHKGHVNMFREAKKLGHKLIAILNNDHQIALKGAQKFMTIDERKSILESIRYIDEVFVSVDKDGTQCETLALLKPDIFANGGDRRSVEDTPETEICRKYDIKMVFGVGGGKVQSSSWLLGAVKKEGIKLNPYIFRNYDIRGVVDEDLDSEKVEAIGKAYGTFLRRRKICHAVVGRDCRLSGEMFQKALVKGLISMGIHIIDVGMIMTQMMYYAQYRFQTNGGAMITASHNPYNYNGFKLGIGYSLTTGPEELQEIKKIIDEDNYFRSGFVGTIEKRDVTEDYYHDVLKRINLKKKFRVVVDSSCGTTGLFLPEILRRAGCEVIERNTNVDGNFPVGTPDPTAQSTMVRVSKAVLSEQADIGLAFDGDGDRIGTVDENGHILWNDVLVAIFAKEILERFPGSKIIYNTLCSQIVSEIIKECGGVPIVWRTGHSFIKSKIAEERAAFGGELSGHFFFADNAYGHDDGAYAVLRILEYLSDKNVSLSNLYESFPKYISSPEIKIGCPDDKKAEVIKNIAKMFKSDFAGMPVIDDTVIPGDDGTRIDFADGMMIFRYSQNGPYVTVKFEAKDQKTYDERKKYVRNTLMRYPEFIWKDDLCVNLECLE